MAVDPTGSVSTPTTAATQTTNKNATLGKDDFLKLMVAQMQNMDPMSQSSDPSQSVQQMTQFSILEQLTNLSTSQDALGANEKQSQAISLLGKTVDYTADDSSTVTGSVQKVDFGSDGAIQLTIDGVTGISPSKITGVK
jgi:flagellar basal-body rod modification protein FlgD